MMTSRRSAFSRRATFALLAFVLGTLPPAPGFAQSPGKPPPPAKTATAAPKSSLIGIWQASNVMGSGWAETYRFFPDGRIIHHTNQMDGESRLRAEYGTYKLAGNTLTLTLTQQTVWVGGKRVPATGSTGTDYELEGYTEKRVTLKKPETRRLTLGKIGKQGASDYLSATIGKTRYWKFEDDPTRYE
jgi:hypothetical protein